MGERIAGWIVSGGIGSVITTAGGTVIGWLAGNPLYGLVIGMGLGMLILMGFAVKAIRVATSGAPVSPQPKSEDGASQSASASPSPDASLLQEFRRLQAERDKLEDEVKTYKNNDWWRKGFYKKLEAERDVLKEDNEQLRAKIEELTPFQKRLQFRFTLQAVRRMGRNLNSARQPDVAAMEKWVSLTSALLRRTLGDEATNYFLVKDGDNSFAGRLARLEDILLNRADSGVELESDFDVVTAIEPYPLEWTHRSS